MKHKKNTLIETTIIAIAVLLLPVMVYAGSLNPPGPPAPTMKTLDEIPPAWSQILPASERFELVMNDEAVLDKETGLVWARNANLADDELIWEQAIMYCIDGLLIGGRLGWRLPSVEELSSLVDKTQIDHALPSGHPFTNVQRTYWSVTTSVDDPTLAWRVYFYSGLVNTYAKHFDLYVWCVRGGPGYDAR